MKNSKISAMSLLLCLLIFAPFGTYAGCPDFLYYCYCTNPVMSPGHYSVWVSNKPYVNTTDDLIAARVSQHDKSFQPWACYQRETGYMSKESARARCKKWCAGWVPNLVTQDDSILNVQGLNPQVIPE